MELKNHNNQKKIALINDFSGFGRCSLAVSMPIISYLGIQSCPIPTSLFSNHTGFDSFFYQDLTDIMPIYINEWKKLDLQFKGIASGFLGSERQINIVQEFIKNFKKDDTIVLVDPVMGDFGHVYPTYTSEMCNKMAELCTCSDIVTPNITEACILTGTTYRTSEWDYQEIKEIALKIQKMGAKNIVISGIEENDTVTNAVLKESGEFILSTQKKVGKTRSGTGDIFSSIIIADAVNGISLDDSVQKAEKFIQDCIIETEKKQIPYTDGVCFEEILYELNRGAEE